MSDQIASPTLPAMKEMLRMAMHGTDAEFQHVAHLCEDEAVAWSVFQSLSTCRSQVDGWLAYLTELHPSLAASGPAS